MSHFVNYTRPLQSPPPSTLHPRPRRRHSFSFVLTMNSNSLLRFGAVLTHCRGAIVGVRANRVVVGNSVKEVFSFIRDEIPECAVGCPAGQHQVLQGVGDFAVDTTWVVTRCSPMRFQHSLLSHLQFAMWGPPGQTLPSSLRRQSTRAVVS